MKAYPSISTSIDFSKTYHVFDKLDGSNIRAEWTAKSGFSKFGSRTQLLTPDQQTLWPSIEKFTNKYAKELSSRFVAKKFSRAVVFFEWHGPNSFAGSHTDHIDDMDATVIDIAVYKRGIIPPTEFLELMSGLDYPTLLHYGKISEEFFQSVRNRTLERMTFEGVIIKGDFSQKMGGPVMGKIKSNDWLNKLKETCGDNDALYQRLK